MSKATNGFWDECEAPSKRPARPVEKIKRVFIYDTYRSRVYEDRTSPEQPKTTWYDWRTGSKERGPQYTKPD